MEGIMDAIAFYHLLLSNDVFLFVGLSFGWICVYLSCCRCVDNLPQAFWCVQVANLRVIRCIAFGWKRCESEKKADLLDIVINGSNYLGVINGSNYLGLIPWPITQLQYSIQALCVFGMFTQYLTITLTPSRFRSHVRSIYIFSLEVHVYMKRCLSPVGLPYCQQNTISVICLYKIWSMQTKISRFFPNMNVLHAQFGSTSNTSLTSLRDVKTTVMWQVYTNPTNLHLVSSLPCDRTCWFLLGHCIHK